VDIAAPTIGSLVDDLGLGIAEVALAPAGLDVPVGEPVIHDPAEPLTCSPGDLVLAVGVDVARDNVAELVRRAGDAGACGIMLKLRDGRLPPDVAEAAQTAGVAIFVVTPEVGWGHLHALVRTARSTAGPVVAAEGAPVALGDLFALANAVAGMVGAPVTIEGPHSAVLAYSAHDEPVDEARRETILGRRVPDTWIERLRRDGVFRRLWASEDVIRVEYEGVRRLAIAIRAGADVLGSIWVAVGDDAGPEAEVALREAEVALREAARIAALHLIRHRTSEDLERRRRGDLFRAVLEGRTPPELLAEPLGVPADAWVTVLAFELPLTEPAELAMRTERAVSLFALYCETFRRQAGCVALGNVVYVVVPDASRPDPQRLVALATDIIDRSRDALRCDVRAGIGSSAHGLRDIARSRREADQVLRVLAESSDGAVADIDAVRSHAILLELRDAAARDPSLRLGKIAALAAHDADHGTTYVATLRAFLDAFGDASRAAAATDVHPNTFRYRLRRLSELAGLDLSDPAERLVAELQLRFLA
jgi:hypothetical protein